jgi:putative spermidine/putrescine transport system permease protein
LLGHIVVCAPFVIRNVMAGLVGLDPRLEEAAMSLGASRVQAFIKVALPLIQSSIISGFIFAFIISFSDINLALFIAGPNSTTLPVYIFNLLLFEGDPSVAAASTLQILIVGLLIWLVQFLFRPRALL